MDLRVGFVERDLEVPVAADDGDARLVRVVEEDELVSLARDESATHHRAVVEETAAEIRRVLAVVEAANHERAPNIPELEGHQDLVVYLGHEKRPAVGAGAKLGNPRPVG